MSLASESDASWRWLSGVFAAPLNLACLEAARLDLRPLAIFADNPALTPGVRRMQMALEALPTSEEGVVTLAHAYTLLFSGAGGRDSVPPYESAFAAPDGRLFGEAEGRMRALLADLDLHVAEGVSEPADHIAIELAAMAELVKPSASEVRRRELMQALDGWLGDFRDACATRDRSGFYAGAAMVAAALVQDLHFNDAATVRVKSAGEKQ
jgi:TorA-specific chaperone